ncbi:MAG: DUF4391 domain-containing protein [Candidatus Riflebacteria bacterium]|nr:DUF4391 domain-containing protein [Candidatus Riflebacteria bacterium]
MIEFPSTTVVNRILPKDKFLEHLDLIPNLKKKLISDIVHIKILNKFSKSVLNFRDYEDQGVIGVGGDCSINTGEDALKLSLEGENKREGDRIRSISSSLEQTQSQAESNNAPLFKGRCHAVTEKFSNNQEKIILNTLDCQANARNDSDNCCSNTLSLNLDNSSSVTLSACKQATSPQGEALGNTYHSSTTNHAEALPSASAIEKPIKEVLLLQIELKKHDFDSKLIETIAKQNSHKLVFLLRYQQYAKLAVYYKQLYIGKWKPFEEVSLTLNGNNMNEVWLSFVEQIALEERREIRDERKEDCLEHRDSPSKNRFYVENNDVASCPKASPGGEVDCQRQDGVVSESVVNQTSLEQSSSQEVSKMPPFVKGDSCDSNRGIFNKNEEIETSDELKTSLSAKADISPYKGEYSKVISKSDLDHKLELQNKAKALEKEIAKLDTAIRREKQPNRKFELHKKLMELEESLRALRLV